MKNRLILIIVLLIVGIIVTGTFSCAATVNYTYDVMGRLTQADFGSGKIVQYSYDTMGNRISQTAPALPPGLPVVATQVPIVLTFGVPPTVYATLEGTVNANRASTTVTFEYGLTTAYGNSVAATPNPVTGIRVTTVKNDTVSGLVPSTTYHYRIKGVNSVGTSYGNDVVFTTPSGIASPVTASPAGGTYSGPVMVTLSGVDALAIFYSTDGSPPLQFYSDPIPISATTTLMFYAITSSGMSEIITETYTIASSVQTVMIDGASPQYFSSLQAACNAALTGQTIKSRESAFIEPLNVSQARNLIIKGGYDATFTTQVGVTTLEGVLTIVSGSLVTDRLVIK